MAKLRGFGHSEGYKKYFLLYEKCKLSLTSLQKDNIVEIKPNKFHSVLRELELEQQKNDKLQERINKLIDNLNTMEANKNTYKKENDELKEKHKIKVNHLGEDIRQMEQTIRNLNIELSRCGDDGYWGLKLLKAEKDKEEMFKEIESRMGVTCGFSDDICDSITKEDLQEIKQKHLKQ